jgi:hypothetical protein
MHLAFIVGFGSLFQLFGAQFGLDFAHSPFRKINPHTETSNLHFSVGDV